MRACVPYAYPCGEEEQLAKIARCAQSTSAESRTSAPAGLPSTAAVLHTTRTHARAQTGPSGPRDRARTPNSVCRSIERPNRGPKRERRPTRPASSHDGASLIVVAPRLHHSEREHDAADHDGLHRRDEGVARVVGRECRRRGAQDRQSDRELRRDHRRSRVLGGVRFVNDGHLLRRADTAGRDALRGMLPGSPSGSGDEQRQDRDDLHW